MATSHAVAAAMLFLSLFACNYVAETLVLEMEQRELKCGVLRRSGRSERTLESELPRRGPRA